MIRPAGGALGWVKRNFWGVVILLQQKYGRIAIQRENPNKIGQKETTILANKYRLNKFSLHNWLFIITNPHTSPAPNTTSTPTRAKTPAPCAGEVNTLWPINSAPAWTCRACNIAKAKWTSRSGRCGDWWWLLVGWWLGTPLKGGGFVTTRWGWKLLG